MMSKVVRRVTSDEAVLTIATAPKGVVAERESGNFCALLGSSGTQWENSNPPYRIFASGNNQKCAVDLLEMTIGSNLKTPKLKNLRGCFGKTSFLLCMSEKCFYFAGFLRISV